jgi:diguanylate cyclase (GGDEF)-like protein/PAS domain S-box-containing protein
MTSSAARPASWWTWAQIDSGRAWAELAGYVLIALIVLAGIVATDIPRFALAAALLPLPLLAPRWPALHIVTMLGIAFLLAYAAALHDQADSRQELLRLAIQVGALGGFCAVLRSIAGKLVRERVRLEAANRALDAERRAVARSLRSLQDLRKAIEARMLVSITDRRGRIIEANDYFCERSGYSRQDLIGMDHRILDAGVHSQDFWREMWRTIRSGTAWQGEMCCRARDGRLYWTDTMIVPLCDAEGRVARYLALRLDITRNKQLEHEHRLRNERIATLYEALSEGVVELASDGSIIHCNPAAEQILGLSLAQLSGRTLRDPSWRAIREDGSELPGDEHPASLTLRTGAVVRDFVHGVHRPDGSLCWVSVSTAPVRSKDGQTHGAVASLVDITAQKAANDGLRVERQALAERKRMLEAAIESDITGYWEWDIDNRRMYLSPNLLGILGRDPAMQPTIDEWSAWVDPGDLQALQVAFESHVASRGDMPFEGKLRYLHATGTTRWALCVGRVVEWAPDGSARRMCGCHVDITAAQVAEEQLSQQRSELRSILDAIPALVYYKDDCNTILSLNRHAADSIGLPPEQIIGRKTEEFFAPAAAAAYLVDDREVLRSGRPKLGIVERYSPDGLTRRTIRTDKIPLPGSHGRFDRLVAVATDITDIVSTRDELMRTQERLSLAISGSRDGIWDWNMVTGEFYFSPRWRELLGLGQDVELSCLEHWQRLISSNSLTLFRRALREHLEGASSILDVEIEMEHADGRPRWMRCRAEAVRDATGAAVRLAGGLTDISELKAAQQELMRLADHDHLTGLANRKRLMDRISQCLARSRREPDYEFALLFLDFDRFKIVNDALGHSVGDALLISIAQRLREVTRETDLVVRFGGDEFVVLLDRIADRCALQQTSERLLAALAMPHTLGDQKIYATASIGAVLNPKGSVRTAEELLRDADAAMYVAKSEGKATYRIFDEAMHAKALDAVFIEQGLRALPFEREFELHYQPILRLDSGQIVGFEALVRWNHPEAGMIMPDRFIAVAEETGLIVPMGRWVIRQAARQIQEWRLQFKDAADLYVNVNISKRELLAPDLLEWARATLADLAIPPGAIKLEITETVIMTHSEAFLPVLEALREEGIGLAMDDFGTGHSSLSALYRLPINVLKLDRSFIVDLASDGNLRPIIAPIVALASNLSLDVVAEGIESREQAEELRAIGCQFGQGYHFAKPMPAHAATSFLRAQGFREPLSRAS